MWGLTASWPTLLPGSLKIHRAGEQHSLLQSRTRCFPQCKMRRPLSSISSLLYYLCSGPCCPVHEVSRDLLRNFSQMWFWLWICFHICNSNAWNGEGEDMPRISPHSFHMYLSLPSQIQSYGFYRKMKFFSITCYDAEQHRAQVPLGMWMEVT